jgi:predicted nucleic acid-binding protein
MPTYFADTSFWVALIDRRDEYHPRAIELSLTLNGDILTSEAVILETVNTFSKPNWRGHVIALVDHIRGRSDIEITYSNWLHGWQLFTNRPDKSWSLTDCISFKICMSED